MDILEEFNSGFSFQPGEGTIELFHGSKGGIRGALSPFASRSTCDFGQGLYLGSNKLQVKGFIASFEKFEGGALFYKAAFNMKELNILKVEGMAWLMTIISFRNPKVKHEYPFIYKNITETISKADVVIGAIADDRMLVAIDRFFENSISDAGLAECLLMANLGEQYALKTDRACKATKLSRPTKLEKHEVDKFETITNRNAKVIKDKTEEIFKREREERIHNICSNSAPIKRKAVDILDMLEGRLLQQHKNKENTNAERTQQRRRMAL